MGSEAKVFSDGRNKHDSITPDDLFTELQNTQLSKYQTELAQIEAEKTELLRSLEELQRVLETATSESANKQQRISELQAELDIIMEVQKKADADFEAAEDVAAVGGEPTDALDTGFPTDLSMTDSMTKSQNMTDGGKEVNHLKRSLRQYEIRYSVALRQLASMRHDLWFCHEREKLNNRPDLATNQALKEEILKLQRTLDERSDEIKGLRCEITKNQESFDTESLKLVIPAC
ncbi:unnamed protein product [Protopolystoma xenopodis]|uniref:Janus kinase and microtubule-interacting protein C-terminal domain-containing protein n=1 Tax=Protopolystoma xenopodis TaxID=117903 RepID=A0A3S5B1Y5_9PLAT|nr:unnamed protein product [Protopolystoma xenopodis]